MKKNEIDAVLKAQKLCDYAKYDNKLYYEGEDGTMGRIDIDNGNIKTGNKIRYPKAFKLLRLQTIICNYLVNRSSYKKFVPVHLGFDFRKRNFFALENT